MAEKRQLMALDGSAQADMPGDSSYGLDVDVTRLPALAAGSSNIGGTTDQHAAWTTTFGVSGALVSITNTAVTAVTGAPASGQKLVVTDIVASTDTAISLLFEEETSGTDILKLFLPASGSAQITTRGKLKLATADKKLTAKASAASNTAITVFFYSEA